MCLARNNLSPKARRLFVLGNLCLVAGLTLSLFDKDMGSHHVAIYDALRGFFLGLAIALNFGALRLARKSYPGGPNA